MSEYDEFCWAEANACCDCDGAGENEEGDLCRRCEGAGIDPNAEPYVAYDSVKCDDAD